MAVGWVWGEVLSRVAIASHWAVSCHWNTLAPPTITNSYIGGVNYLTCLPLLPSLLLFLWPPVTAIRNQTTS